MLVVPQRGARVALGGVRKRPQGRPAPRRGGRRATVGGRPAQRRRRAGGGRCRWRPAGGGSAEGAGAGAGEGEATPAPTASDAATGGAAATNDADMAGVVTPSTGNAAAGESAAAGEGGEGAATGGSAAAAAPAFTADPSLAAPRPLIRLFESKFLELRATYATITDELSGRMPLAYTQLVQILVDLLVVSTPFALLHALGGSPAGAILGTGVITLFYSSVLNLAKVFLDPYDNEQFGTNSLAINVATLLQETNVGSTRWSKAAANLPLAARPLAMPPKDKHASADAAAADGDDAAGDGLVDAAGLSGGLSVVGVGEYGDDDDGDGVA